MKLYSQLTTVLGLSALIGAMLVAPAAHAQSIGIDVVGNDFVPASSPITAGYTFTVNSPVTVSGLAFFDFNSDGLASSHDIGLWDGGGSLLTSATIGAGTGTPTTASTSTAGEWRTVGVSDLTLTPGSYTIGATLEQDSDVVIWFGSAVADPNLVFGHAVNGGFNSSTLTFPTSDQSGLDAGFFGPSIVLKAGATAPEPGSIALLLLGAPVMAGVVRRRIAR